MAVLFLDSSALVKRYIEEEGTAFVVAQLESGVNRVIVSRLADVELISACARRVRAMLMTSEQLDEVAAVFEQESRELYHVIELGGAVMNRAVQLARVRALRAADAIQLACALIARDENQANTDFRLVSSDDELNAASQGEGLVVIDPRKPE